MSDNINFAAPRKTLGQNFLQDPNIIRKIVSMLAIKTDDCVVEIGPGRGALTELILPLAGQTHLIEFDRDLAAYWRQRSDTAIGMHVYEADILKFDLHELLQTANLGDQPKIKVIGNLPYNISSPVLFHLMEYADAITMQVVMLQKEVVQRMSAEPGSKQFGRLSVMLQYRYQIEYLFTVPPSAFFPPPKVESAIARLTPRESIPIKVISHRDFSFIVKQSFSQRRKTLRNTLKGHLSSEQIASLEIDASDRAEALSVQDFVRLANLYSDIRGS